MLWHSQYKYITCNRCVYILVVNMLSIFLRESSENLFTFCWTIFCVHVTHSNAPQTVTHFPRLFPFPPISDFSRFSRWTTTLSLLHQPPHHHQLWQQAAHCWPLWTSLRVSIRGVNAPSYTPRLLCGNNPDSDLSLVILHFLSCRSRCH